MINIPPNSIVVPGLTGTNHQLESNFESSLLTLEDAHAHVLHYGFKMNLNLEDCTSVDGLLQLTFVAYQFTDAI